MKLTSNTKTLAENKVLILYVLDIVKKPINNDDLFQLIQSINDMNYFYFQQFIYDLLEDKYIKYNTFELTYTLTETRKKNFRINKRPYSWNSKIKN